MSNAQAIYESTASIRDFSVTRELDNLKGKIIDNVTGNITGGITDSLDGLIDGLNPFGDEEDQQKLLNWISEFFLRSGVIILGIIIMGIAIAAFMGGE